MIPNKLRIWDTIGIIAPSTPLLEQNKEGFYNAKKYFESLGFKIKVSKNIKKIDKWWFSTSSWKDKAHDINKMFTDKEIDAIWCLHGWKTANWTLDYLDYDLIKRNPKIFLWKSDIDLLHLVINKMTWLTTFHCPDFYIWRATCKDMDFEYSKRHFEKRLVAWEIGQIEKASKWKCIRPWIAEWKILGCCITPILKLAWTKYFPDFTNSILFLESYAWNPRDMVSFLVQLKQLWIYDKINGIVIWYIHWLQNKDIFKKDPKYDTAWNKITFEDMVLDATKDYDFPILKINEFGHYNINTFLPIWAKVKLDSKNEKIEIIEKCVI